LLVTLDELEDIVDVMFSDYNGESHGGLGGRTPLEAIRHFVTKQTAPVRTLAQARRNDVVLLQESRVVPVKGSVARGVRPHINFHEARYSSDVLSGNVALIGKQLRIYFDSRDLRRVRAYFENGDELGVLIAARPWCFTAHSLRTRREILRLRRLGKLRYREGDDAVEAWANYRRKHAARSKRAARDLAKLASASRGSGTGRAPAAPVESAPAADKPREGRRRDLMPEVRRESMHGKAEPQVKPMRIRKAIVF
jgi:hypothetical protein